MFPWLGDILAWTSPVGQNTSIQPSLVIESQNVKNNIFSTRWPVIPHNTRFVSNSLQSYLIWLLSRKHFFSHCTIEPILFVSSQHYIYVSIISNWPKQCINKCIDKNLTKSVWQIFIIRSRCSQVPYDTTHRTLRSE